MDTTSMRFASILCIAASFAACAAETSRDDPGGAVGGDVSEVGVATEALCFTDRGCASGQHCNSRGQCVECTTSSHCTSGSVCSSGRCVRQPVAGSSGAGSKPLYATCNPNPWPDGDCGSGKVCTTIMTGGFRCYQGVGATGGCPSGMTAYMGTACLNTCDPTTVGGFCPQPLACNHGWCTPN
jgi:Cys-rich repeat protein